MRWLALLAFLPACSLVRSPLVPGTDRDGGRRDGGAFDAGPRDAPAPDIPTCGPSCDDMNPCTDDRCEGSRCTHTANTAPCEDGLYCTTGDACTDGTCRGGRVTCPACIEATRSCGTCSGPADCPLPTYGACTFDSTCDEAGTRSVTTYTCTDGDCVESTGTASCGRVTEGLECAAPVTSMGPCVLSGTDCSSTGTRTSSLETSSCVGGGCVTNTNPLPPAACTTSPVGEACESCRTGSCVATLGECAGNTELFCGPSTCIADGVCGAPGSETRTLGDLCGVPRGTPCGALEMCGACRRPSAGDPCEMRCTYTIGQCDGAGTCGNVMMRTDLVPCGMTCPVG